MKEALLIHWFSSCFGCHMTNSVPWLLVVGAVKAACPGGEFEARKQATTRLRGEVKWRNNWYLRVIRFFLLYNLLGFEYFGDEAFYLLEGFSMNGIPFESLSLPFKQAVFLVRVTASPQTLRTTAWVCLAKHCNRKSMPVVDVSSTVLERENCYHVGLPDGNPLIASNFVWCFFCSSLLSIMTDNNDSDKISQYEQSWMIIIYWIVIVNCYSIILCTHI